jgi:hypothetical protein
MAAGKTSVIACNLEALTREERGRREELAARVRSLASEIAELEDGYGLRLPPDASVAHEAMEWILLESRCCPFLRLEVSLEPERGPLWVRLGGSPEIKDFLAAAGLGVQAQRKGCGC